MNIQSGPAPLPLTDKHPASGRVAGALIAAASLLSVVLMAHHPSVATPNIADAVAELARQATLTRQVHGGLIVLLGVLGLGFIELSRRLGIDRRTVQGALVAYAVGSGAMIGAALISGFIVPGLGVTYVAAPAADLEPLRYVLVLCRLGNRTLAGFAVSAMSAAILLWSIELLRAPRAAPIAGCLGVLVAVGPVALLAFGAMTLDVGGMTLVVVAQALWSLAVSVPLMRARL
jgi:hypothetical protein